MWSNNYGPHFPRYIGQKMWSRRHKNSDPYSKGLPQLEIPTHEGLGLANQQGSDDVMHTACRERKAINRQF